MNIVDVYWYTLMCNVNALVMTLLTYYFFKQYFSSYKHLLPILFLIYRGIYSFLMFPLNNFLFMNIGNIVYSMMLSIGLLAYYFKKNDVYLKLFWYMLFSSMVLGAYVLRYFLYKSEIVYISGFYIYFLYLVLTLFLWDKHEFSHIVFLQLFGLSWVSDVREYIVIFYLDLWKHHFPTTLFVYIKHTLPIYLIPYLYREKLLVENKKILTIAILLVVMANVLHLKWIAPPILRHPFFVRLLPLVSVLIMIKWKK